MQRPPWVVKGRFEAFRAREARRRRRRNQAPDGVGGLVVRVRPLAEAAAPPRSALPPLPPLFGARPPRLWRLVAMRPKATGGAGGRPASRPRFLSAGGLPARSRLRRRYGAWLSSGYLPYLLRSRREGSSRHPYYTAAVKAPPETFGPRSAGQPVVCTSSGLSRAKASWRARTASSTRSFRMMHVSRISLVEIISMLMLCSKRVRNIRAA